MELIKTIWQWLSKLLSEEEEDNSSFSSYAKMLELNRDFKFILSKNKVATKEEFDAVFKDAVYTLEHDITRFVGEDNFKFIDAEPKKDKECIIGCMRIYAENDGIIKTSFHRRDEDGLWDGYNKKLPKISFIEPKWSEEKFFILEKD